jgi:hypothetical protein
VPLAAAAGPPYLSLSELSPWIVVFAVGLFAVLFAAPFLLHASIGGALEDDARWERALVWWGGICTLALLLGLLLVAGPGISADSLAGSLGTVLVVESALVLATLVAWLLSS